MLDQISDYLAPINGILTLVIALATVIYAALTYSILKEMRASRHVSHRPRLIVLPPKPVTIKVQESAVGQTGFDWSILPRDAFLQPEKDSWKDLGIWLLEVGLKNIGTAPAINVRISTQILSDEFEVLIETREFFKSQQAEIGDGHLRFPNALYSLSASPAFELPICVASPTTDISTPIQLPYEALLRFVVNMFFKDRDSLVRKSEDAGFRITVKYDDLDRNSYEAVFDVKPSLEAFTGTEGNRFIGLGSARMNFKSKQGLSQPD